MAKYVRDKYKEFFVFAIIGGIMTLINFLLLALFVEVFRMNPLIANAVSYLIAVILSYFVNAIITFNHAIKDSKKEIKKLLEYCIMKLIFLMLDTVCLNFLLEINLNLYVSKLLLTIIFTFGSYGVSKVIIKG